MGCNTHGADACRSSRRQAANRGVHRAVISRLQARTTLPACRKSGYAAAERKRRKQMAVTATPRVR